MARERRLVGLSHEGDFPGERRVVSPSFNKNIIHYMFFAHIQYPIIDLRHFLNDKFKRDIPVFPAPMANTWLRNFGHVRERRTDTCRFYTSENYYCEAHNAVKFEELPLFKGRKEIEFIYGKHSWISYPFFDKICKFRRFRSDGKLKSCFDIGILINSIDANYIHLAHQELKELFVNVKSSTGKRKYRVPLFELGNHICKLYEESTRINKKPEIKMKACI